MSEHVINLPYQAPPLSLNGRQHRHALAGTTRHVRADAVWLARATKLPKGVPSCSVQLHYRPPDNRRRDADNLVATLKPLCDGMVDYGLVPDDTPRFMGKPEPIIHRAVKGQPGKLWLVVTTPK